jgi:hypothetical protein
MLVAHKLRFATHVGSGTLIYAIVYKCVLFFLLLFAGAVPPHKPGSMTGVMGKWWWIYHASLGMNGPHVGVYQFACIY